MSKQPNIKRTVKRTIAYYAVHERDKPRLTLALELQGLIREMGEVVPSEDTLVKMISKARNRKIEPIDKPWHLGTLGSEDHSIGSVDYSITPAALPMVVEVKRRYVDLTIREALWISRLSALAAALNREQPGSPGEMLQRLYLWAMVYAAEERVCKVANLDFDTSVLDALLFGAWDTRNLKNAAEILEKAWPNESTRASTENLRKQATQLGSMVSQKYSWQLTKASDAARQKEAELRKKAMERILEMQETVNREGGPS